MEIKNKKVLHIITLFSVGGATENTVFTVAGLIKKGYKVDIATGPNISSEGSMYSVAKEMGIPVYTFSNLKRAINPIDDLLITFKLFRFIKKNKYDIVHTHSSKAGVVGRIAAWLAKTPIIIHGWHAVPYNEFQLWCTKILFKNIEKFLSRICDKNFAVTHTIVKKISKDKIVTKDKCVVVRSGFNTKSFSNYDISSNILLRKKYNILEDDLVIGKIGRLSPMKGHIYLLQAFKEINKENNKTKLLLVGSGEYKKELDKYICENKLSERVIFTGLIPPEEIPSIISIIDIVAHTSLSEGLPRVFMQSMLMGKPVISFDLDGAHEIISDGKNGYLIEAKNVKMLSKRLLELSLNKNKIVEMGNYAKNNMKEDFSIEAMVEHTHKIYEELFAYKL